MLTREQIINADIVIIDQDDILYVLPKKNGDAFCYHKDTMSWWLRERDSLLEILAKDQCSLEGTNLVKRCKEDDSSSIRYREITGKEAWACIERWKKDRNPLNALLDKAIVFAVEHHAGQYRKGSETPYILHPIEVLSVLRSMYAPIPLLIAGVLHDTVEDTEATRKEVEEKFGEKVLALVLFNTEDKSGSWDQRKQHTIDSIKGASKDEKMLVMADKVANLRTMVEDYRQVGEELWNRFGAPKEKQKWYYCSIYEALEAMKYDSECCWVYGEMESLIKALFQKETI